MPGGWRATGPRDKDGYQPMNIQFTVNLKRSPDDDKQRARHIDALLRRLKKKKEQEHEH
jgi:ribosome-binding factor A